MSQKNVELLLGKIVTDDEFRYAFLPVGPASFALASRFGLEFTAVERAALSKLQPRAFESLARDLDARILRSCELEDPPWGQA